MLGAGVAHEPPPFSIQRDDDGRCTATDGEVVVALLESGGRMFRRRAIKGVGSGASERVEWLVTELDGVRVYVGSGSVIVTRQDLVP